MTSITLDINSNGTIVVPNCGRLSDSVAAAIKANQAHLLHARAIIAHDDEARLFWERHHASPSQSMARAES